MRILLSLWVVVLLAGCQCGLTPLRVSVRHTDDAGVTRTLAYPPQPAVTGTGR